MSHFADRLIEACVKKDSVAVVGLDPHWHLLPEEFRSDLPSAGQERAEAAAGRVADFCCRIVELVADSAAAVKPQVAFFEQLGWAGMRAYAQVAACARELGLLVIGDVKRADIGSTASAYRSAHLAPAKDLPLDSAPFQVDAVTVNPYLGADGVTPFLEACADAGKGVFVLVRTSNPSSDEVQALVTEGGCVWERVASLVVEWAAGLKGGSGYSSVGAVVGATQPKALAAMREMMPGVPFLIPGFGAQGGGADAVAAGFDERGLGAIVNSSRGILFACRTEPWLSRFGPGKWEDAVVAALEDMNAALNACRHG